MSPGLKPQSLLFERVKHPVVCDDGNSRIAVLPRKGSEFP